LAGRKVRTAKGNTPVNGRFVMVYVATQNHNRRKCHRKLLPTFAKASVGKGENVR
jgi:hypothetical protein